MRFAALEEKLIVEGGGAVALAALIAGKIQTPGKQNAVVVSGGNVSAETLTDVLAEKATTEE
jgi:threonine dehydratase